MTAVYNGQAEAIKFEQLLCSHTNSLPWLSNPTSLLTEHIK